MSNEELKETAAGEYVTTSPESPFGALAEALYRERVLRARRMPPEQKILAGQRLFEAACRITLAGIRNQFPGQTEAQYQEILRQRLLERRKRQNIE